MIAQPRRNRPTGEEQTTAVDDPTAPAPTAPYSPALDAEAMLLSSLMAVADTDNPDAAYVLDYLSAQDFSRPILGRIFALMARQYADAKLITPAALSARIEADRDTKGWGSTSPQLHLLKLYELGGLPTQITFYANEVLGSSYRRQFSNMVTSLHQASQQAQEDDLFGLLVAHGRSQRTAFNRRKQFLDNTPKKGTDDE